MNSLGTRRTVVPLLVSDENFKKVRTEVNGRDAIRVSTIGTGSFSADPQDVADGTGLAPAKTVNGSVNHNLTAIASNTSSSLANTTSLATTLGTGADTSSSSTVIGILKDIKSGQSDSTINTTLNTINKQLTAKNAANEDKSVAQSAVDTVMCLVDDPTAPVADQVKVGAAVKRIRDTIGQTTDADTENTTIGLLKKIKANTDGTGTISGTVAIQADQLATLATETTQAKLGTEATLSTRASEATLALVSKDATTQSIKTLVGTVDDTAGTNTVIGLLKGIAAKFQ